MSKNLDLWIHSRTDLNFCVHGTLCQSHKYNCETDLLNSHVLSTVHDKTKKKETHRQTEKEKRVLNDLRTQKLKRQIFWLSEKHAELVLYPTPDFQEIFHRSDLPAERTKGYKRKKSNHNSHLLFITHSVKIK